MQEETTAPEPVIDETSLVVDVGTNAEIVLGNRDRLLACSSPTGPAFEGAQISCGQHHFLDAGRGCLYGAVFLTEKIAQSRFGRIDQNLVNLRPAESFWTVRRRQIHLPPETA